MLYKNTALLSDKKKNKKTQVQQSSNPLPLDSSSKLKELLSFWDWEDTNDCALGGSERHMKDDETWRGSSNSIYVSDRLKSYTATVHLLWSCGQFGSTGIKSQSRQRAVMSRNHVSRSLDNKGKQRLDTCELRKTSVTESEPRGHDRGRKKNTMWGEKVHVKDPL